ncbi:MAG: SDR family NAD(P)-dependent oxidoreductase [Anaerolineae bacterium]|nr:SDR family NAD(P)-dependent oxidoreductase [Anaerolineae bacterium]
MDETLKAESRLTPHKRVVVVGASSGIGAALAQQLASEGYLVAALARRAEVLEKVCMQINEAAGEGAARGYVHDAADHGEIPGMFQKILRELGGIDALVYVAGVQHPVGINEYDIEKDREMIEVNLLGAMAWMGEAARLFEQMKAGQIVGISSVAGDRGRVGSPAYNTSKAGMNTYLEALRNRLTRHGVNVLTVKPGFVESELMRKNAKMVFGVISPEKAAKDIWRAMRKRKQQLYTPGWWRWLMLGIQHTPSFIFRRLSF